MQTHGNFFFVGRDTVKYDDKLVQLTDVREIEEPFRYARNALVIRTPFPPSGRDKPYHNIDGKDFGARISLILGIWRKATPVGEEAESHHLISALGGKELDEIPSQYPCPVT